MICDDDRVRAMIGGWDGRYDIFSSLAFSFLRNSAGFVSILQKSFKSLGTLKYHQNGCQVVVFAWTLSEYQVEADEDEDGMSKRERKQLTGGVRDKLVTV